MNEYLGKKLDEWLRMYNAGHFAEARDFYFEYLFAEIIERFELLYGTGGKVDMLFSILGFTPEPIILAQRALKPDMHIIFYTDKGIEGDNESSRYLEKYLTSNYQLIKFRDESFKTIYNTMKEQLVLHPTRTCAIDITGGKKSTVASVAIFGRDYNADIFYVDYDQYIPELRRPKPGTEKLSMVYSPIRDLPEMG